MESVINIWERMSKMCKYCEDLEHEGPMEFLEGSIKTKGIEICSVEAWMHNDGSRYTINLAARIGDDYIVDKYKQIKYCPFCGRELKD